MVLFLSFFRMPISRDYPLREPVPVMGHFNAVK